MIRFLAAERVLPELGELYEVLDQFGPKAQTHVLARVWHGAIEFPIHGVVVGAERADAPTLALIGGVHGLEAYALERLLDDTLPHHIYEYEPVSHNYRPPVVIAISLGAMVGLTWLSRWPLELRGLVTINTSAGALSWPHGRSRLHGRAGPGLRGRARAPRRRRP